MAGEDYFRAMRIPLIRGRYFTAQDKLGAPPVAVVNEEFVRRFFPKEDPIGKRIDFSWDTTGWQEIVGVVGNIHHEGLDSPPVPEMYLPFRQRMPLGMSVVVRTATDPVAMAQAVRERVFAVDKEQPVSSLQAMDQVVSDSVSPRRLSLILYGSFAGLALVLAMIGIYGVMSYMVTERTHEIGIRMALGAERRDVLRLVVKQGLVLTLIGTVVGVGASFGLTRFLANQLFDVKPTDPATFAAVVTLLIGVALVASFIPARRATKVDPMVALRYE
jgi:putative ABC transport system permease protein